MRIDFLVRQTFYVFLLAQSACNLNLASNDSAESPAIEDNSFTVTSRSPIIVEKASVITVIGTGFKSGSLMASIEGLVTDQAIAAEANIESSTVAKVVMPNSGTGVRKVSLNLTQGSQTESIDLIFKNTGDDLPIITADASKICSDVSYYNIKGEKTTGTKNCSGSSASSCTTDGEINCLSTSSFPAASTSGLADKIASGQTVAGVSGTFSGSYSNCSANGVVGCLTTTTYKSADLTNLSAGNIKSGVTIAGQAGDYPSSTYKLSGSSGTADLDSSTFNTQLASSTAFEYWDSTGTRHTGAGDADLTNANVKSGVTIFGANGNLSAGSTFDSLTSSLLSRDPSTTQMTLATEKSSTSYASGYREIPNIFKDDTAFFSTSAGCTSAGGASQSCTPAVWATRATTTCGTTQSTVSDRIADCASKNSSTATWNGATNGIAGEASWKLVTYDGTYEVWRDERTGLLWSDKAPSADNWCKATGNYQSDDPSNYCNNATYQDQTTPYSYCVESTSHQPSLSGEDWTAGTYHGIKGGMGKVATANSPSVRWRLPTRWDYMQAEIDGIKQVLPSIANTFWTATIYDSLRGRANYFIGSSGTHAASSSLTNVDRWKSNSIRCVGR